MRKLVTIKTITDITSIDGADKIETATIDDAWQVVIRKDEFKLNEKCVYFEIDSILPENDNRFSFLMKDVKSLPTENNTVVRGVKLRTIRLKGQISQGLALPLHLFPELININDSDNLAQILNIEKYELPQPICKDAKGNFPSFIPKTDQERIQNCYKSIDFTKYKWEVTRKYDGCSATYYYNNGEVGICSRNLELKIDENQNSVYHQMNNKYGILKNISVYCKTHNCNLAIQGEIYGLGIQGNPDNLTETIFITFDVYNIDEKRYLTCYERYILFSVLFIPHTSHLNEIPNEFASYSLNDFLDLACQYGGEGLVFKRISNERISFKVINNNYLIKG